MKHTQQDVVKGEPHMSISALDSSFQCEKKKSKPPLKLMILVLSVTHCSCPSCSLHHKCSAVKNTYPQHLLAWERPPSALPGSWEALSLCFVSSIKLFLSSTHRAMLVFIRCSVSGNMTNVTPLFTSLIALLWFPPTLEEEMSVS